MKRIDRKGLSGAEIFFLMIIVLLILVTGGMAYALLEMGPQEEPNFVVENVYFEEKENGMKANIYLTNLGKTSGECDIGWEVTNGTRLLDNGTNEFNLDERTTQGLQIDFDNDGNLVFELELEVSHDGESMDSYTEKVHL